MTGGEGWEDDADDFDAAITPPPYDWAQQLLRFWFADHGEQHWFGGGPAFDDDVAARAGDWWRALRQKPTDAFLTDPDTALAAILLFDQVPRNIHRDHADAFATDHIALDLARAVVARGWDTGRTPAERLFLYLPFEHSEDLSDQNEALRLIAALDNPAWLDFAQKHHAMIERFGRFPHRNGVLGRADRPGEAEAVAAGNAW